jgi:hypothetical protein
MHSTIATILALLRVGMTTGHGAGSGTITNGTGIATGSPITLSPGVNTIAITHLGTFTVTLPADQLGTAASGTCTVDSSPVTLTGGVNTINTSGSTGTIIITLKSAPDDFWVKTWYTGDPLQMPSFETPSGAVIPLQPISRDDVFVGEDTVKETIAIRFYQPAVRVAGEAGETAPAYTRLTSMFQQAEVLLRADPTFASAFVNSRIVNIDPQMPGIAGGNVYRIAEIVMETISRRAWGALEPDVPIDGLVLGTDRLG